MYLNPEGFVEKYLADGMPYFKVFRGGSTADKMCMYRMMERPEGMDDETFLAQGAEKLTSFFDMYPDGGFVTVLAKTHPRNKEESSVITQVKWGAQSSTQMQSPGQVGSIGFNPATSMKQMLEMMALMKGVFGTGNDNAQQQLFQIQLENAERQRKADLKALQQEFAWKKKEEEYEAALMGAPPTLGETLTQELVGLIKPLAHTMLAKQAGAPIGALPIVNGMEATAPPKKAAKAASNPKSEIRNPQSDTEHPMMNMSMDLTLSCVRAIMENVFPDYNVNEVMPALAHISVQHRDIIRQFTIMQIEANRQQAQAIQKPYPDGTNDEEE